MNRAPATRSSARRLTVGALTLSVGEVVGKLGTLGMLGLMARQLGAADFGLFSLGLGLGLLLASVVTLGFDQRLVQLVGAEPESLDARLSALLTLRMALAITVVTVSAIVLMTLDEPAASREVIAVLVVAGCSDTLVEAFRTAANVRAVQVVPAAVLVVQRLLALGLVAWVLAEGHGVVAVAWAYCAASLGSLVVMAGVSRVVADVRPRAALVTRHHLGDFLRAVRVTGINDLVSMTLFRLDVVLLAVLAGEVAVGHYTAAYRLLETVLFVSWSLCRVVQPSLADTSAPIASRAGIVRACIVLVAGVYVPYTALLVVRGEDLMHLLFGAEFASAHVLWGLCLAPLAFGLAQVGATALLALRPDPAVLWASTAALATNVGLNLALIPAFGAVAAAVTTSLSYVVQAGVTVTALRRVMPVHSASRPLAVVALAAFVAAAVMLVPMAPLVAMAFGVGVYVLVWGVLTSVWDRPTLGFLRSLARPA